MMVSLTMIKWQEKGIEIWVMMGSPPQGLEFQKFQKFLVSQNARKFKDKDNLGGVPKIKE